MDMNKTYQELTDEAFDYIDKLKHPVMEFWYRDGQLMQIFEHDMHDHHWYECYPQLERRLSEDLYSAEYDYWQDDILDGHIVISSSQR